MGRSLVTIKTGINEMATLGPIGYTISEIKNKINKNDGQRVTRVRFSQLCVVSGFREGETLCPLIIASVVSF